MPKTGAFILRTAVVFLVVSMSALPAATETVQVQDDIIFVGDGDPNGSSVVWCPQIDPNLRPALVFIEGQMLGEQSYEHLYVRCFHGTGLQRQEITWAKSLQVTQLDHGIFLVGTSGGATDRGVFVIDLDRGMGRLLAHSTRISCLRSVPERGKAMLIHHQFGSDEVRYLELDLRTLSLTLWRTFEQADLGEVFTGTDYGTALSPDFQRVAYMSEDPEHPLPLGYQLMLLDLTTMQGSCLADGVTTRISPISSMMPGPPPLDWIDSEQIVYRHIPVPGPNNPNAFAELDALCIFRRVAATTGQSTEVLQEKLRLTLGSGSLKLSPLNGELIYNDQWTLDPNDGTLTPAIVPYSIVNEYQPARASVSLGEQLLQVAGGTIPSALISPRHQHLAYVLHREDVDPAYTIYGKIADIDEPVKTAEGTYRTAPAGWIE